MVSWLLCGLARIESSSLARLASVFRKYSGCVKRSWPSASLSGTGRWPMLLPHASPIQNDACDNGIVAVSWFPDGPTYVEVKLSICLRARVVTRSATPNLYDVGMFQLITRLKSRRPV